MESIKVSSPFGQTLYREIIEARLDRHGRPLKHYFRGSWEGHFRFSFELDPEPEGYSFFEMPSIELWISLESSAAGEIQFGFGIIGDDPRPGSQPEAYQAGPAGYSPSDLAFEALMHLLSPAQQAQWGGRLPLTEPA